MRVSITGAGMKHTCLDHLPVDAKDRLLAELGSDEFVHWAAQPVPGLYKVRGQLYLLFSLLWTACCVAVAGFIMFNPPDTATEWLFTSLLAPALCAGVFGIGAPSRIRRKVQLIIYAVTNRRALVVRGAPVYRSSSYFLHALGNVSCNPDRDGNGRLVLHEEHYEDDGSQLVRRRGFNACPQVEEVERLVTALAAQASG